MVVIVVIVVVVVVVIVVVVIVIIVVIVINLVAVVVFGQLMSNIAVQKTVHRVKLDEEIILARKNIICILLCSLEFKQRWNINAASSN